MTERQNITPGIRTRLFVFGGLAVAAGYLVFSWEPFSEDGGASNAFPRGAEGGPIDPQFEKISARVARLELPSFFLGAEGSTLTSANLTRTHAIIREHISWMDAIITEYEYSMMTDGNQSVYELKVLKESRNELLHLVDEIEDSDSQLNRAIQVLEETKRAGTEDARLASLTRELFRNEDLRHVFSTQGNLKNFYVAAHKISLLQEHGIVWVGGAPRNIDEVWGVRFTSDDEKNIPRRTARAMYEFFKDNWNANLVTTEGHTGNLDRPTSYGGHKSAGHRFGYAFDVDCLHAETPQDVYNVLKASNAYYEVRYEVNNESERRRMIHGVITCAVKDGMSYDRAMYLAESRIRAFSNVTGGHFHVESTGRLGISINPDGPSPRIA